MINRNRNNEDKDNEIDKIATLSSFSIELTLHIEVKVKKGILNEAIIISKELLDLERMDLTQVKENSNIKFGCYIYQDGLRNKDILHIASECERLGYDSIWIKDNFIPWIQDYTILHQSKSNNVNNRNNQRIKYQKSRNQARATSTK